MSFNFGRMSTLYYIDQCDIRNRKIKKEIELYQFLAPCTYN